MKEILIFAGTTEGRTLSDRLCEKRVAHTICVATEYGEIVMGENPFRTIQMGRMDAGQIRDFVIQGDYKAVVDATHPYAKIVTDNIKQAVEGLPVLYLRLLREDATEAEYENVKRFDSSSACAAALASESAGMEGNILLTTGSKELSYFCTDTKLRKRLYVRVLPSEESMKLCKENGIVGKQIIALQGPFSEEINEALINQYDIRCLVTKESGKNGGYLEKVRAVKKTGISLYVIGHEPEREGEGFEQILKRLEAICGMALRDPVSFEITLIGTGMGSKRGLTLEALETIKQADVILGAKRMIREYTPRFEKHPFYTKEEIIPYLLHLQENPQLSGSIKVAVLFSGDTGFYSGCKDLYTALQRICEEGKIHGTLRIIPGISSVSYLASRVGETYQDGGIYSMHGKELPNLCAKIKSQNKVYLLLSGADNMRTLGRMLMENGLEQCRVTVGYQLSYPEEEIKEMTPKDCLLIEKEGLYTCLIRNPDVKSRYLTHGVSDAEFIRGRVPMTKEEIRQIVICKLRLKEDSLVYDIGSGTGSIAVEIAGLSDQLRVYAIEQKEEAISLIGQNAKKFCLENIIIVKAKAPESLDELPVPTHAFIGGSGGNMKEILSALYKKNPNMRIVISAVTLETISEIQKFILAQPVKNAEVVQIQISRANPVGKYHLLQAENPVFLCSFNFAGNEEIP